MEYSPKVLIVEDDSDTMIIIRRIVQMVHPKCDIRLAVDGQHALERMKECPAIVVITDYVMSPMNGLELAQAIRQSWPTTFIIMVSAYKTEQLEHEIQKIINNRPIIDRFVEKPFCIGELTDAIKEGLHIATYNKEEEAKETTITVSYDP